MEANFRNRFNGLRRRAGETVQTVSESYERPDTQLKQGVKEKVASEVFVTGH